MEKTATIVLREAQSRDTDALAELRVASLIEMEMLEPSERRAFRRRARDEFHALLEARRIVAWVLCADATVVGCACAVFWERLPYPGTSLHAEIAGVYVAPRQRGRGHASALLARVLESARERGVRRIVLQPSDRSRPLYRRFGFGDSGQMRLPVEASAR